MIQHNYFMICIWLNFYILQQNRSFCVEISFHFVLLCCFAKAQYWFKNMSVWILLLFSDLAATLAQKVTELFISVVANLMKKMINNVNETCPWDVIVGQMYVLTMINVHVHMHTWRRSYVSKFRDNNRNSASASQQSLFLSSSRVTMDTIMSTFQRLLSSN